MKLLAIDSSATAASAALLEDGVLRGEFFINTKLTHSQTLMPMVDALLKNTCIPIEDIDMFAVAAGPGSFTGVRIGVAAVKGMAMAQGKPCVSVSTLEAMAYTACCFDGLVCAVMDARCHQVYNALFQVEKGEIARLTPDRALSVAELAKEISEKKQPIFLVGDGADLCYNHYTNQIPGVQLVPAHVRFQHASGVGAAAYALAKEGKTLSPAQLMPVYLRLPQAERELKKKKEGKQ